jgi:hypothetical protein
MVSIPEGMGALLAGGGSGSPMFRPKGKWSLGGLLMIRIRSVGSLVALAVLMTGARAAENPQVKALHEQIAVLKAEEKATVKALHAWYDGFVKRDKFSEEVLREERKVLLKQEEALVSVATTPEARKDIRAHFESLRGLLKADIKLDRVAIKQLRELEKAQETYVANAYKFKIAELEAAAKLLSQMKKK